MMVHVTSRTVEGRFLLRPGPRQKSLAVGCLHRALQGRDVQLHAVVVASNHFHLLLSPASVEEMALFVGHFKRQLTLETQRMHGWRGSVFAQRYDAVVVSDEEEAQLRTLRYVLAHGAKEGIVLSPREWPGVHSAAALADGVSLRGTRIQRKALWQARRRCGAEVDVSAFSEEVEVELTPPPCWAGLGAAEIRRRARDLVASIEEETRSRHAEDGTAPHGAEAAQAVAVETRPAEEPEPAGCLRFHAWSRRVRRELIEAFSLFIAAYRAASEALLAGQKGPPFPSGCYPPRGPFVAASA